MILRVLEGPDSLEKAYDLSKNSLVIGRDKACDLRLDEDGISRRHCKIYREGSAWFVEDLYSTNGVSLNGKKISVRKTIQLNDKIRVGKLLLLFTDARDIVDEKVVDQLSDVAKLKTGAAASSANDQSASPALIFVIMAILLGLALVLALWPDLPEPVEEEELFLVNEGRKEKVVQPDVPVPENIDVPDPEGLNGDDPEDVDPEDAEQAPKPIQPMKFYYVKSEPSGARVFINGEEKGQTPLLLRDLTAGDYDLELKLENYEPLNRKFYLPHRTEFPVYKMKIQNGSCLITSRPSGMTIRRGSEILGQTPFIFKGYKGRINLLVDDPGYLAQRIEVELYDFKSSSYHVNMKAHAGSLKIITRPAGARIFIEAHDKGVSVGPEGKEGFLLVKGLRPGKTNVWAEYKDQKSALQTVVIKRAETVDLTLDIPMPEKKTSPEAAPEK